MFRSIQFMGCGTGVDTYELVDDVFGAIEVNVPSPSRSVFAVIMGYSQQHLKDNRFLPFLPLTGNPPSINPNIARFFLWRKRQNGYRGRTALLSVGAMIREDQQWVDRYHGVKWSFNSQCVFNHCEKIVFARGNKV